MAIMGGGGGRGMGFGSPGNRSGGSAGRGRGGVAGGRGGSRGGSSGRGGRSRACGASGGDFGGGCGASSGGRRGRGGAVTANSSGGAPSQPRQQQQQQQQASPQQRQDGRGYPAGGVEGANGVSNGGQNSRVAKRPKVASEQPQTQQQQQQQVHMQQGPVKAWISATVGGAAVAAAAVAAAAKAGVAAAAVAADAAAAPAAKTTPEATAAVNSNWDALKAAVAAAKKAPPPPAARRRQAVAAAAGGASGTVGAAVKRPGLVGNETGPTRVLALDCEMVGTGPHGVESVLARVCIVNSAGAVLMDTFVQPKSKVTDYRTWVSGVRRSDIEKGRPHDDVVRQVKELVRGRILVGHAIGNDLRALELHAHPRDLLRDTSMYPGLMKELPSGKKVSASLKELSALHLGLAIQQGEHTPVDDARAALYLYQLHQRDWEAAIRSGHRTPVSGLGLKKKGDARGKYAKGGKGSKEKGHDGKPRLRGVASGGVAKKPKRRTPTDALDGSGAKAAAVRDKDKHWKQKHKEKKLARLGGAAAVTTGAARPNGIWSLDRDPYADL